MQPRSSTHFVERYTHGSGPKSKGRAAAVSASGHRQLYVGSPVTFSNDAPELQDPIYNQPSARRENRLVNSYEAPTAGGARSRLEAAQKPSFFAAPDGQRPRQGVFDEHGLQYLRHTVSLLPWNM